MENENKRMQEFCKEIGIIGFQEGYFLFENGEKYEGCIESIEKNEERIHFSIPFTEENDDFHLSVTYSNNPTYCNTDVINLSDTTFLRFHHQDIKELWEKGEKEGFEKKNITKEIIKRINLWKEIIKGFKERFKKNFGIELENFIKKYEKFKKRNYNIIHNKVDVEEW